MPPVLIVPETTERDTALLQQNLRKSFKYAAAGTKWEKMATPRVVNMQTPDYPKQDVAR